MTNDNYLSREEAVRRVRERFERERSNLIKDRMAERREVVRSYNEELTRYGELAKRTSLRRAEALNAHDQEWMRERARLSSRTTTAPLFGLLGPPRRNVQKEYADRRERWEAKREGIRERYAEQLRFIGRQRRDLTDKHALHLISLERTERLLTDDLKRRQENGFNAAVDREMNRAPHSLGRHYARQAGKGYEL